VTGQKTSVVEALALVMADVGAVPLDGQMSGAGQSFRYRSINAIHEAVRQGLTRHGVLLYPRLVEHNSQIRPRDGKADIFMAEVVVEWTVVGPAGDQLDPTPSTAGVGLDTQDKAMLKAQVQAEKVFLTQLFQLSEGGDVEASPELGASTARHQRPPKSERKPAPPPAAADASTIDEIAARVNELPSALAGEWKARHGNPTELLASKVKSATAYLAHLEAQVDQ
jgi:hypothetical protein